MTARKILIFIGFLLIIIIIFSVFGLHAETVKEGAMVYSLEKSIPLGIPHPKYRIVKDSVIVPILPTENKKIILLTIDDGPSAQSLSIMEILKKHNAKAIFFINGIHHKKHKEVIKELSSNGFEIGNHTWSHNDLRKEKNEIQKKEIDDTTNLIKQETGMVPKFFRAPYGMINPLLYEYIKTQKMTYVDWSASVKDWQSDSKEKEVFIKHAIDEIHGGSILLIHEYEWSQKYLDDLLTEIEKLGYSFVDPRMIDRTNITPNKITQ